VGQLSMYTTMRASGCAVLYIAAVFKYVIIKVRSGHRCVGVGLMGYGRVTGGTRLQCHFIR
jgi:hypothetical protein